MSQPLRVTDARADEMKALLYAMDRGKVSDHDFALKAEAAIEMLLADRLTLLQQVTELQTVVAQQKIDLAFKDQQLEILDDTRSRR